MTKFEYQFIGFNTNATPNDEIAKQLIERGENGWEVVSVGWPSHAFVLLKRQTKHAYPVATHKR